MTEKVSIILPCHNRWKHTEQSLNSLFKNTPDDLYNLYVVEDKSTDSTKRNLEDLQTLMGFTLLLNEENIGPAASRNNTCGFLTAQDLRLQYLYHSDNDVYFTPGWLETLIKEYELVKHKVKILGGGSHPFHFPFEDVPDSKVKLIHALAGYSHFMDWSVWDKYGPYAVSDVHPDHGRIMGSEDWLISVKIKDDGYHVGAIFPEIVYNTGITNTYGKPTTGAEHIKQYKGIEVW